MKLVLIGSEAVRMGLLLSEESEGQSWSKVELFMVELLILVISRDSCVESPVEDNYVISECEGDSLREKVLIPMEHNSNDGYGTYL